MITLFALLQSQNVVMDTLFSMAINANTVPLSIQANLMPQFLMIPASQQDMNVVKEFQ